MWPRPREPPVPTESDPPPVWGYFPVEQYLIRNWDYESSSLTTEEQRLNVIRDFLCEEKLDAELLSAWGNNRNISRVPTEAEVHLLLEPWRPPLLRKIAYMLMKHLHSEHHKPIFLRTHYGGGSVDEMKMMEWIADDYFTPDDPLVPKEEAWWRILKEKPIFEFGEDWNRVLDFLPEIMTFRCMSDRSFNPDIDAIRAHVIQHPSMPPEEMSITEQIADEVQYQAFSEVTLVVFDKSFFETGKARLIYLDKKGNEIRWFRATGDDIDYLRFSVERLTVQGQVYWWEANVGPMYQAEGEIGRMFYGTEAQFESMTLS